MLDDSKVIEDNKWENISIWKCIILHITNRY